MPVSFPVALKCDGCGLEGGALATINSTTEWDLDYPEPWEVEQVVINPHRWVDNDGREMGERKTRTWCSPECKEKA